MARLTLHAFLAVALVAAGTARGDAHPRGACAWCREQARETQMNFELSQPNERADAGRLRSTLDSMCYAEGGQRSSTGFNLCEHTARLTGAVADWAQGCTLLPGVCDPQRDGVGPLGITLDAAYVMCEPVKCVSAAGEAAVECSCAGECTPQCRVAFLRTIEACRECTDEWAQAQSREKRHTAADEAAEREAAS